jgi:SAM-dependent methyltransferase
LVDAAELDYAKKLEREPAKWWKLLLDVQRPFRWNLKRLDLGRTLDVGCGVGRHLVNLPANSVGVDSNEYAVARARARGCDALTPEEFISRNKGEFDSILLSHILEHLTLEESRGVLRMYLPYLRGGGRVVVICPQEKGFGDGQPEGKAHARGGAHITFLDGESISNLLEAAGLEVNKAYSFPLPRPAGKVFHHNETVVVAVGSTSA